MKQNDVSAVSLTQHAVDNFLCRNLLAVRLPPVVRVNLLSDDQVAHLLCNWQLRNFRSIFRLVVYPVRRPEQN